MATIRVLTERELRDQIHLDSGVIACIETALAALAIDTLVMPPILSLAVESHNGEIDVKTAYVPGIDRIAIKVSTGYFDNPNIGLPSLSGLMVVLSARTGQVEALLLDNGYLTDIRTAAAGAVAAKYLAREDASCAAVLGGGLQARLQLQAMALVRPIRTARIWARRPEQAREAAEELSSLLAIEVEPVAEPEQAIEGADVIVTTTPSRTPLVQAEWISSGQHITAMGSDAEYKTEIAPAVLARADHYVCDRVSQCAALGELRPAVAAGIFKADHRHTELAEVITGRIPGRRSEGDITIADLTGTGVQDTAIAALACARCAEAGVGSEIES